MARQKTSPLEEVVVLVSKMPWWVGLVLALISFLILHAISTLPHLPVTGTAQMEAALSRELYRAFAMFGKFVLPFVFGLGALISGYNTFRDKEIFDTTVKRPGVASLNEMSWADFERLVSEYYRRQGFQVTREGGSGPDGGIDLVMRQKGEIYLVQCKQWKAYKVGAQPVREFYGVMAAKGAAGGYFVTSGEYTNEAKAFVQGLNLELVDGSKLRQMINDVQQNAPTHAVSNPRLPIVASVTIGPACPKCGSAMKKRVARQGTQAGKEFWGCLAYPKCKGTTMLEDAAEWTLPKVTAEPPPAPIVASPLTRNCPTCGTRMGLRSFQGGPKQGQQFYGCISCKKAWPVVA